MTESQRLLDGTGIFDHRITVPLNWQDPDGEKISVYAREFRSAEAMQKEDSGQLPVLLFLQGGPGGKGSRPSRLNGWMAEAAKTFRIMMLDQRGTGLSTPLNRQSLAARGDSAAQVEYLRHFRADSIVADAEALREHLGLNSWSVLGQSYGGFCTLSYLSFAHKHLDRAMLTGGLGPLTGHADRVYRQTYALMAARNAEYFNRFPQDRERLDVIIAHLRRRQEVGQPVRLLDGSELTVPRLQMLGMYLGGNTRIDSLHYLLEEAFSPGTVSHEDGELTDTFLAGVGAQLSFAANPMYAVMHESIYGQPAGVTDHRGATNWAAERVRDEFPDFSPEAASPLLTGEMILPEHIRLDPALAPLTETAEALAQVDDWPILYDLDQLAHNTVPTAAAVYTHDVYVAREISLETASKVAGMSVYETDAFHHDGIGDDGPAIIKELLSRTQA